MCAHEQVYLKIQIFALRSTGSLRTVVVEAIIYLTYVTVRELIL